MSITREDALALLHEYTESESLRKHAYAVEAAMRAYARKMGGNEDEWGMAGLLHDFDYERYPTEEGHPFEGNRILEEHGYPERLRRAIMSHADHTGVPRENAMERALYAVDELCGFLMAVSYVRPDRSIASVKLKSVKKKMKDRGFARAVSREDLLRGAEELGVPFEDHVAFVIEALTEVKEDLGV